MMEPSLCTTSSLGVEISGLPRPGQERDACVKIYPEGFFIRHPPAPHQLDDFTTSDDKLFQTIHMGAAVVDTENWLLVVDGLVQNPFALTMEQLLKFPRTTVTAFHECYGSPLKPPTDAVWRIGNVHWTGVRLADILAIAEPRPEAQYVWSEGLDYGTFAGVTADRYQKDLPIQKALRQEVLLAFEMNGHRLGKGRGGPVRLIVPGWFGTNMTKWICRLSLQNKRAPGPYTTVFYNEIDPTDPHGSRKRPVWSVEVNSIITSPAPDAVVSGSEVAIEGWAWCHEPVVRVLVTSSHKPWADAVVKAREGFSWQRWKAVLTLAQGEYVLVSRAVSQSGTEQPLHGRRNHVHRVRIWVKPGADTD
ncbi:hypothetical protein LCI18_002318 [Fusarium solani-melongenae]|uniref:Uncharacterized protein n=1 Tax=Fusarium solani subsp. cucurbitae TaxID=2747967 RepID=A0ACD3YU49_FUSSC|nr:hypothetical protein LCI18_002318 [Fusarium solani-melongenae]